MKQKCTAQFVDVSPEQALVWLDKNTRNRKLRKWNVIALSEAIKRGEWITTHQGIAFCESGRLLDGQHRLHAIVMAETTVRMLVVTGIDDAAFQVIDRGLMRTYSDVTKLPRKTGELAAIACRYLHKTNKPSPQQVLAMANAGMIDIQSKIEEATAANVKVLSSAPVRLAVAFMILKGYSERFVLEQYKALVTRNYQDLTETSQTFLRRVDCGDVDVHDADDVITRAMRCFDPTETNLKKIYASPEQKAEMRTELCEILSRLLK
jgi:alkylhydroperoxidase/carboxymuconolactone decarboxylase family protein YurZ